MKIVCARADARARTPDEQDGKVETLKEKNYVKMKYDRVIGQKA